MLNRNRHEIIGHVGTPPELKVTPNTGRPYATFTVATNRRWKGADGQPQERTDWHRVVTWAERAEFVAKHLRKGSYVCVVGRSETREFEHEGVKKFATELVAQSVDFLQPAAVGDQPPAGDDEDDAAPGSSYDGPT